MKWPEPDAAMEVPLYGGMIYVFKSRKKFAKAHKFLGVPCEPCKSLGLCQMLENEDGAAIYLVGWFDGDQATLVHELAHVALFVCERAGVNPSSSNGEPFCYLLGDIYQSCLANQIK